MGWAMKVKYDLDKSEERVVQLCAGLGTRELRRRLSSLLPFYTSAYQLYTQRRTSRSNDLRAAQ